MHIHICLCCVLHSNIRCLVVGHICMGYGHFAAVDFESAIKCFKSAIEVSADPFYSQWPRAFLGMSYLLWGQMQEAEEALHEVVSYCQNLSCGVLQPLACAFLVHSGEKESYSQKRHQSLGRLSGYSRKSAFRAVRGQKESIRAAIAESLLPPNLITAMDKLVLKRFHALELE